MVSPPRQVVIDDSNSQVHYVGSGWFPDQGNQDNTGNFGPAYKKTSHRTEGNGSISFSFIGSSVTVWGTMSLELIDNGAIFDPRWECFVDGMNIEATEPSQLVENNLPLCQQGILTSGPHVITINVTATGNAFWFDYLTFTPSGASGFYATLLVQNTDSAILYDAGWRDLDDSANMTTKIGSEMKFDFVGTSLTWVGFIPTGLPHNESMASYSIDGGSSTSFVLKGLPPTAINTVYNQVFFTTPDLPIGHHTIVVTYEGSNTPSTPLTLDYLFITHAPLLVKENTTTTASAVTTAGTTAGISASTVSHSIISTGPIVGGVIGGLTAISILLVAILCWHRRRALHAKSRTGLLGTGNGPSHLRTGQRQTPYTTTPSMQHLQAEPFTLFYPSAGGGHHSPKTNSQSDVSSAPGLALPDCYSNNGSSDVNQSIPHTRAYTANDDNSGASGYASGTIGQVLAGRKNRRLDPIITPVDVPPMYTTA